MNVLPIAFAAAALAALSQPAAAGDSKTAPSASPASSGC